MEKIFIDDYENKKGKWIWGIFFKDNNGISILSKSPYKKVIEKRLSYFKNRLRGGYLLSPDKSEGVY